MLTMRDLRKTPATSHKYGYLRTEAMVRAEENRLEELSKDRERALAIEKTKRNATKQKSKAKLVDTEKSAEKVPVRRPATLKHATKDMHAKITKARKKRAKKKKKVAVERKKQWIEVEESIDLQLKEEARDCILQRAAEKREAKYREIKRVKEARLSAEQKVMEEQMEKRKKRLDEVRRVGRKRMAMQRTERANMIAARNEQAAREQVAALERFKKAEREKLPTGSG